VCVSFVDWNGDIPAYSEMEEIWVKVEGIPPKYLSWRVMMRVATALGIPVDVDWHEIFRSFYKVLRINVAVRDVTKIPSNRLMEFGGRNFMLSLSVVQDSNGGDIDEGDDPDDNQGKDEIDGNTDKGDDLQNNNGNKPMETEQSEKTPRTSPHAGGAGQGSGSLAKKIASAICETQLDEEARVRSKIMGTPGVQYKTGRGDRQRAPEENIGVQLLAQFDSEADDDEDEEAELDVASVEQIIDEKKKTVEAGKRKWGPVVAIRMSNRIVHDGKSIIERAKELKKNKNLDQPKGIPHGFKNSFAVLDNICLMNKAHEAGISLGIDENMIDGNIDAIKHLEKDRLVSFRDENPDMFLPANLDISHELSDDDGIQDVDSDESDNFQTGDIEEISPWVEVFSKRSSSRRKLVFRSNGSRPYMETKRS
jgi:hypothetical protein